MDPLAKAILGQDTTEPDPHPAGTIVEGKIKTVDAVKGISFTVPDWDDGKFVFGPAPYVWPALTVTGPSSAATSDNGNLVIGGIPYPHDHGIAHTHDVPVPTNKPSAGDRVLVVFVGDGVGNPWVVGWWPK